jgi:hypothetical protein
VTLPVAFGAVMATRDGYAMVADGVPGADRGAATGLPSPLVITLGPDGQVQAGPARLIDLDIGPDDGLASPGPPLFTSEGRLAAVWSQDIDMSTNLMSRLIFRQVPGDLSGLTPVGSPLPPRACGALAPPPAGPAP